MGVVLEQELAVLVVEAVVELLEVDGEHRSVLQWSLNLRELSLLEVVEVGQHI